MKAQPFLPGKYLQLIDRGGPLHFSHQRQIINQIRKRFGFEATPIVIKTRPRNDRH